MPGLRIMLSCSIATVLIACTCARSQGQSEANPFADIERRAADDPFDVHEADVGEAQAPATSRPATGTVNEVTLLAAPPWADTDRARCHCANESGSPSTAKIEQALAKPLTSSGLDFPDVPLNEVVTFLQDEYDIPIQLDTTALDEIGIGPDEPVSVKIRGISLESGLRLLLDQLDLTFLVRYEVLMITTPEDAESELQVCVYDVHDLLATRHGRPDFDSLIDAIVSCVDYQSWAVNGGGEADIRPLEPGMLVISQTQGVHRHVSNFLDAVRRTRGSASAPPADVPTRRISIETRSYSLIASKRVPVENLGERTVAIIRKTVPAAKETSVDGQPCWIDHLAGRIVVHHTPEVQDEIQAMLIQLDLIPDPRHHRERDGGFGGGGGFGRHDGGPQGGRGIFRVEEAVD